MPSIKKYSEACKRTTHEREGDGVRAEFGCVSERSTCLAPPIAAAQHCSAHGCRQCAPTVHGNGNGKR